MELEFESDEPITWPTFTIDFGHLQDVNNEVLGWIWIYDTVVNYPVVQSGINNDAYLYKPMTVLLTVRAVSLWIIAMTALLPIRIQLSMGII